MSQPDRIPLARPELGEREEELVLEVLRSGRLSLGPMQERFERAFADRVGAADAVAVSSGTSALHLGVRALGWGAGDEVVTSPFSFVASVNCLLYEGVTPVFCDIDLVNFKVRILNENRGTAAVTRVLLDSSDGVETWGTIGVSENIIEASWEALVDSLEAGMLPGRAERTRTRADLAT